jgi:hypothetical protein
MMDQMTMLIDSIPKCIVKSHRRRPGLLLLLLLRAPRPSAPASSPEAAFGLELRGASHGRAKGLYRPLSTCRRRSTRPLSTRLHTREL